MSTILNTNGVFKEIPVAGEGFKAVIVCAEWNSNITFPLRDAAIDTLLKSGVRRDDIKVIMVPGTVELVFACSRAIKALDPDAVIAIGCVIRGDTPHFDYVCHIAASGIERLNSEGCCPVAFGVITTENLQQAIDRAGGALGNKGAEAAEAAIVMGNLRRSLPLL